MMRGCTSDIVEQSTLSRAAQNCNVELFPRATGLAQRSQNLCPSGNHPWGAYCQSFPCPSDTRTGIWHPIRVRNDTTQSHIFTMGQSPSHETSVAGEPIILQWNETYEDGLTMQRYPTLMTPTAHPTDLLGAKVTCNKSNPVDSLPSILCASLGLPTELDTSLESTLRYPPLEATSQSHSQECYRLWKEIPEVAIVISGSSHFVPQELYKPRTEADKDRYLERVSLSPPIIFMTREPLEWGIPLEDICNGKTQRLVDKDVLVLHDCGPSVSIRINWPGYPPFRRRISSRNWRKTKGPITKEKLAQSLAKTTGQFIEKMSRKPLEADAEGTWRVGIAHIRLEDLVLVSLHHVSKGSWQPQFRLRRDLVRGPRTESHCWYHDYFPSGLEDLPGVTVYPDVGREIHYRS